MTEKEMYEYMKSFDFSALVFSPKSDYSWPDFLPRDGYYGFFLLHRYAGLLAAGTWIEKDSGTGTIEDCPPDLALSYLESGTLFSPHNPFVKKKPYFYSLVTLMTEYLSGDIDSRENVIEKLWSLLEEAEKSRSSSDRLRSLDILLAKRWGAILRVFLHIYMKDESYDYQRDLNAAKRNGLTPPYAIWVEYSVRFHLYKRERHYGKLISLAEAWENQSFAFPLYHNPHEFSGLLLEHLYEQKEFLVAREWLDLLLRRHPEYPVYQKWKIRYLRDDFQVDAAKDLCVNLLTKCAADDELHCLMSNLFFLEGEYLLAKEEADEAIRCQNDCAANHVALAYAQLYLEEYEPALDVFLRALAIDENNIDAYRGKSKALYFKGQHFEALSCLQTVFRKVPGAVDLCYDLADTYFSCGYLGECKKYCLKCLKIDPSYVNAYVLLGMAESREYKDDEAAEWFEGALQIDPSHPVALNELAFIQHLNGNDDICMELLEKAVQAAPDYPDALCSMGIVYSYQGKNEEAKGYFDKTLELDPYHVGALVGLGNLSLGQCDYKEALVWYDKALDEDPYFPEALFGKVNAYRGLGMEEEAFKWIEKMKESDSFGEEL